MKTFYLGVAHRLHLVICNGLGFWVSAKKGASSSTVLTTSTAHKDEIDSDEEDLSDDVPVVSRTLPVNNSSNSNALSNSSSVLLSQSFNINNDDNTITNETSVIEESNNLSIDIVDNWPMDLVEYLDPVTGDSIQQHIGDVMKKCRSLVKLINKSSVLMNYVLNLKKQLNIQRSLQLDCKSRWNSSYRLVESILKYKKVINKINSDKHEIGLNKKQVTKLSSIQMDLDDWEMLKLIEFVLKPIVQATGMASGSTYPTIGVSYFAIYHFREFLENDDDGDYSSSSYKILNYLKSLLLKQVQKYFIDNNEQLEIMKVIFCLF